MPGTGTEAGVGQGLRQPLVQAEEQAAGELARIEQDVPAGSVKFSSGAAPGAGLHRFQIQPRVGAQTSAKTALKERGEASLGQCPAVNILKGGRGAGCIVPLIVHVIARGVVRLRVSRIPVRVLSGGAGIRLQGRILPVSGRGRSEKEVELFLAEEIAGTGFGHAGHRGAGWRRPGKGPDSAATGYVSKKRATGNARPAQAPCTGASGKVMHIIIHRPWLGPEGICEVDAARGQPLFQAIWLSGRVEPVPLCGGIGRCGRCRVRFVSPAPDACAEEVQVLGEAAVAEGWRLACRCHIADSVQGIEIELAPPRVRKSRRSEAAGSTEPAVMAVDLGTTSVAWRLLAAADGRVLDEGEDLNPQAGTGADVISRIAVAMQPGGGERLAGIIRSHLASRIEGRGDSVQGMVVAANTAMSEIFAGTDVSGLAGAPYRLSLTGGGTVQVPGLPPVYLPPLAAPFVGGDVTAGLVWLEARETPRPYLLAALGATGEIVLLVRDRKLNMTSVPLGPSLEGIGLECGSLAGPDVLTGFSLGPMGLAMQTSTGPLAPGVRAQGISATGYLSLIELLLGNGLMDAEGHLGAGAKPAMPLARRLAARVDTSWQVPRFMVTDDLWVSLRDIEEILKVKAAFSVAVRGLMEAAGLVPAELACLAIAGALGRYVRPRTLERLGFVPMGTEGRVRTVGNSSLEGACLLALHPGRRGELASLCAGAVLLQPAQDPNFHERYLQAMRFAH